MEYQLIKLNTARNSLRYIIRVLNIKELYLPYYICPTLRISAIKEGCKLFFYNIDLSFRPVENFPKNAFILYPNYFGVCSDILGELEKLYPNLIVDNAHSFYSEPTGIASFNSLRKFFPKLRNGSFLYVKNSQTINLNFDDYEYELKNLSYKEFCENENFLDSQNIKMMSFSTEKYINSIDFEAERNKRISNFRFWHNKLNQKNLLKNKLNDSNIPFCYPFLPDCDKESDYLVEELKKQGIEIFRYWNNLPDNFQEKIFYTNLVAIPL